MEIFNKNSSNVEILRTFHHKKISILQMNEKILGEVVGSAKIEVQIIVVSSD
jgi:hypothetical protein